MCAHVTLVDILNTDFIFVMIFAGGVKINCVWKITFILRSVKRVTKWTNLTCKYIWTQFLPTNMHVNNYNYCKVHSELVWLSQASIIFYLTYANPFSMQVQRMIKIRNISRFFASLRIFYSYCFPSWMNPFCLSWSHLINIKSMH